MKSGRTLSLAIVLLILGGWLFSTSHAAGRKSKPKSPTKAASESPGDAPLEVNADGKVVKSNAEWKKLLTKQQFRVARMKGTETPYENAYWNSKKDGLYRCVCCRLELFDSRAKFDSGTGWPSFWQPIEKDAVAYQVDHTEAEPRTEVLCRRCDAHLGHVFSDGPPPTGQRYCMNSASLKLVARPKDGKSRGVSKGSPKR